MECQNSQGLVEKYLTNDSRNSAEVLDDCDPDKEIKLLYNGPLERISRANLPILSPVPEPGRGYPSEDSSRAQARDRSIKYSESRSGGPFDRHDGFFEYILPFKFHGKTEYSIADGVEPFTDVFGRPSSFPSSLRFRTGHMKPRLARIEPISILSPDSQLELPISYANLTGLQVELEVDNPFLQKRSKQDKTIELGGPQEQVVHETLNVLDWLGIQNGQLFAEVSPQAHQRLENDLPKSCFYLQVTPYNVQARVGMASSMAWVTDLETGELVADAKVELIQRENDNANVLASSKTDRDGIVQLPGKTDLVSFPIIDSDYSHDYSSFRRSSVLCSRAFNAKYAIRVSGPKGHSTLPLEQAFVESDRRPVLQSEPHLAVWGHTAQGIYSPGDDLQYKIYIRKQTDNGFDKADEDIDYLLVVLSSQGELVHYRNAIELNEFGAFHGGFQIPQDALGTLRFVVLMDYGADVEDVRRMLPHLAKSEIGKPRKPHDSHWIAFGVDVLDFVPATVRLESNLDAGAYRSGGMVTVRGRAELLSGGPFSDAPVSVRMQFLPKPFVPQVPQSKDFKFASSPMADAPSEQGVVDSNGAFRMSRRIVMDDFFFYGTMKVTTGVKSVRGSFVWDYQSADFRTSDRFVGMRLDKSPKQVGKPVSVSTVVTDARGVPMDDLPISVEFARRNRGDGYQSKWSRVHSCQIKAELQPELCVFTPERDGYYRATATIKNEGEPLQKVEQRFSVRGKLRLSSNGERRYLSFRDRNDLYGKEFTVGEVAELAIEHSIPNSHALVTVERLGVLDQWVVNLEGDGQYIDIPLKKEYSPRVRVSVIAMVAEEAALPNPTAGANDTRPHARIQRANIFLKVRDPDPKMNIDISTDKDVYEPGETVRVSIETSKFDGRRVSTPLELAVAVVDQGVLEVSRAGIGHYDPIEGFSNSYEFAVQGFGLLSRDYGIVYSGMRLPLGAFQRPKQDPRENNELLSQWIPSLRTNGEGKASFEFKAGDRLTEWKIIVIAADTTRLFGSGHKSIKTRLDLEIHPVLPNQVTDSDVFDARYSVLNRTDSERSVEVAIATSGDVEAISFEDSITLKSYERKIVTFPQTVSLSANKRPQSGGSIRLLATATSDELSDAVVQTLSVQPDNRIAIHSIYGTSVSSQVAEPVEFPRDVKKDTGSLKVVVTSSLIRSLDDKLSQIKDYPYSCWEQQLSKAVIAARYGGLKKHFDLDWSQADDYLQSVLGTASDYQTSTGGFDYWGDGGGYSNPLLSAYTARALKWVSDAGYEVPDTVISGLLDYLQNQLGRGQSGRSGISGETATTLHAMIVNALVQYEVGDAGQVESFFRENENLSPFALAQTLQAALAVDAPRDLLDELSARLMNSIAVSGDKAMIQHDVVRNGNVLHSSMLRTTCSAISTFVQARNSGKPLVSDESLASLVRGAVYEWNKPKPRAVPHRSAYCFNAIAAYAATMETEMDELDISVKVAMGRRNQIVPRIRQATGHTNVDFATFETALKRRNLGKTGELVLSQLGQSRLYYKATMQYEPIETKNNPQNHGIDISRSYWIKQGEKWNEIDDSSELQRGDLVRVRLVLDARDPLDFVIVDDPVPGALEPVDPRLATTNLDDVIGEHVFYHVLQERISDFWLSVDFVRTGFYRRELRHESVKFVSDFLNSGKHEMLWTGRVIATGDFLARPTHAESMYSPEIYGKSSARRLIVASE